MGEAEEVRENGVTSSISEVSPDRTKACPKAVQKLREDFPHSYGFKEDKSIWFKYTLPCMGELRFNPIVSLLAVILIWTFVGICGGFQDKVPFLDWKSWMVDYFTWLYVGAQDSWAIFMIILYLSKYSAIKLGKDTDVPEYSDPTWFMMLFACGIGTGLFFFGVAEPLYHYVGPNRYTADPTMPDNTVAQIAINLTLFHWGIHGWIVYSLVGLLLALLSYREGLPMTMKSCFYPLLGDRVFGWIGDLIDVISIITTLFGVCTSLGLGTRQLNVGLTMLNSNISPDDTTIQVIIIWCITAVATMSTVSGVGMGIRRLSETCFMVGMFLMIVALFMDQTFFILNLYVQSLGYYIQWIIQLGFHTDAWEQLGPSHGGEDRNRWVPDGVESTDGPSDWMDSWTMFYWGWWISWCPFVGMFIAKISKGRTIKQFINGTLTAPVLYSFIWLVIFGGAGIRLERGAAGGGYCCPDKTGWFLNSTEVSTLIEEQGWGGNVVNPNASTLLCSGDLCGSCASGVLARYGESEQTYDTLVSDYNYLLTDFGSVSPDRRQARISCHTTEQMWFDLMRSYGEIGSFLSMFSLIGIILYFVTSSDSGSLVIDCLSSNGDPDPPTIQRVFWALMEGATATALLYAGGKDSLVALQAAGLLSGLPYTFLVSMICTSIWRVCQVAAGDLNPLGPSFAIHLFDPFAPQPYHEIRENFSATVKLFCGFLINLVLAPFTVAQAHGSDWMDSWTMFYWGWWISWCPFVGMFIAKISKGRTIKQFINGTLTAPVLYSFIWLVIFGGAGIRLERGAAGGGYCCPDKTGWFLNSTEVSTLIEEQGWGGNVVNPNASTLLCSGDLCGSCASGVLARYGESEQTYDTLVSDYNYLLTDFGSVSPDRRQARISCHTTEQMWFDLMRSYGEIGSFLSMFSLIGIILYFVTSSDSGSLVIDCLSSNGDPDPPTIQRVFWALMEGATATALLYAGGKDSLVALQAAGLLSGLPYTFLVSMICTSIWRVCQVAAGDLNPLGPSFAIHLFDPFAPQPYHEIRENFSATVKLFCGFLINLVLAPFTVAQAHGRLTGNSRPWVYIVTLCVLFGLFVLFHLLQLVFDGAWAMAWFFYLTYACVVASVRIEVREHFKIAGNGIEDLFASILLYPCCALQLDLTTAPLMESKGQKSVEESVESISMEKKSPGSDNLAFKE
eukprot:maker-scaffold41_size498431-snap-gene-3.31 protein:Tk00207 transcript:maker-scaffold41_size498431-snap-gene-3.31-mRNA-1 annotation:"glycine betaine transporter -like"